MSDYCMIPQWFGTVTRVSMHAKYKTQNSTVTQQTTVKSADWTCNFTQNTMVKLHLRKIWENLERQCSCMVNWKISSAMLNLIECNAKGAVSTCAQYDHVHLRFENVHKPRFWLWPHAILQQSRLRSNFFSSLHFGVKETLNTSKMHVGVEYLSLKWRDSRLRHFQRLCHLL